MALHMKRVIYSPQPLTFPYEEGYIFPTTPYFDGITYEEGYIFPTTPYIDDITYEEGYIFPHNPLH